MQASGESASRAHAESSLPLSKAEQRDAKHQLDSPRLEKDPERVGKRSWEQPFECKTICECDLENLRKVREV